MPKSSYVLIMIEMELVGVRVELPASAPIVLLRESSERGLFLPIFVGNSEATAIALAMDKIDPPRPMTHDLLSVLMKSLDAELLRVVVTDIQDKTFFAELHIRNSEGTQTISSRPSDAIALALRMETQIFVVEDVLQKAGYHIPDDDEPEENVLAEFRTFLDDVTPDDFLGDNS